MFPAVLTQVSAVLRDHSTPPQPWEAPGEHLHPLPSTAVHPWKHPAGKTHLDINPGFPFSPLSSTLLFQRGRKKKKEQGKKPIFIYRCFLLAHFAPQPLQARAATENQMNSQLLPSNSIRGGKQRPATALEEGRAASSLLPQGWPGDKGLHPQGTRRRSLPSIPPASTRMWHPPGLGVFLLLTSPTWLCPRTWLFLQVFIALFCICRADEGEVLLLL